MVAAGLLCFVPGRVAQFGAVQVGVRGFPVFVRVAQGMGVLDSLYAGYGNAPLPQPPADGRAIRQSLTTSSASGPLGASTLVNSTR